jgi:hypothetical protein
VFVVAIDEGTLAAAGRKLGRLPAAVSRAIAFLEKHAELLHRTTRSIKPSEEGELPGVLVLPFHSGRFARAFMSVSSHALRRRGVLR